MVSLGMGDVTVPNCWQLGDAVVNGQTELRLVGIIIDLIYFGDHGDIAVVYWPAGVESVSCSSLYPAFC